jgi:serine/threonine-protein kinase
MLEGTQVGAYRVLRQIGAGGMGEVWLAEHGMLGRRAAIKVLRPAYSTQPEIVTRFFNEARAATAIADPGIVQIFDFGHHTDGSAYIVMELLEGEALDKRLARHGRLAEPDALRIMRQVASTLGAAHARGIVHRDLKPENIFLVRDPEVPGGERAKVLDFGIAKLGGQSSGVETQTAAMMGTPLYMSPEQCRGAGEVDQRADVYSLGCVLFTLVTGLPPFYAEGVGDIIAMHLREIAPRASTRASNISPAVDQLIACCLEKEAARRFASGGALATAIDALLGRTSSPQVAPVARAPSAPIGPTPRVDATPVAPFAAQQTTLSTAVDSRLVEQRLRDPV